MMGVRSLGIIFATAAAAVAGTTALATHGAAIGRRKPERDELEHIVDERVVHALQHVAVAGPVAATDGYADATLTVVGFNDQQIGQMLAVVDTATKEMTDAATTLGAAKKRIDIQKSFTQSLMDSFDRGVGQLVDADMNVESTRLQALQVQQQLGIQALSIANSNAQTILSLFR